MKNLYSHWTKICWWQLHQCSIECVKLYFLWQQQLGKTHTQASDNYTEQKYKRNMQQFHWFDWITVHMSKSVKLNIFIRPKSMDFIWLSTDMYTTKDVNYYHLFSWGICGLVWIDSQLVYSSWTGRFSSKTSQTWGKYWPFYM